MTYCEPTALMEVFTSACSVAEAASKLLTSMPPPTLHTRPAFSSMSGKMPLMSICAAHLSGRCPTPTHCTKPHSSPSWRGPLRRSRLHLCSNVRDYPRACKPAKLSLASPTQPRYAKTKNHPYVRRPAKISLSFPIQPRHAFSQPRRASRHAKNETNKQRHGWGGHSIQSMADAVQLLAPDNIYSSGCLASPLIPQSLPIEITASFPPKWSAQPQGGSASGTTPAPLLAPQPILLMEQKVKEAEVVEEYNMDGKEEKDGQLATRLNGVVKAKEEEKCDEGEGGGEEGEGGGEEGEGGGEGAISVSHAVLSGDTGEEEPFQFTFSIDNLKYHVDDDEFSLEGEPVEFASPELREQLLAKVKARGDLGDQSAATIPPEIGTTGDDEPGLGKIQVATELGLPRRLNLRHQLQRSTFSHLSPGGVKSLGRWTSWTGDSLEAFLSKAFTRPRFDMFWSEYSPEERVEASKMVDWRESFPDDPPPSYLLANLGQFWSSMS